VQAAIEAWVAELEENEDCEDKGEEEKEQEAKTPQQAGATKPAPGINTLNTIRCRRAQAVPPACARVQDLQALSVAAMDACCPASGGGHRRLQASCDLPAACPSAACAAACAAVFVPYMQHCAAMLVATPGVPVVDCLSFAASCAEMQAGAGQMMLQPVAVQMFRVLVNTEGAAQAGVMFTGGGMGDGGVGDGKLDRLQPLPPVPPPPPDATGGGDDTTGVTRLFVTDTNGCRGLRLC
jgi:hypothetical protein